MAIKSFERFYATRPVLRRIIFFFPVQLFLVQLKKNHLLLLYWVILFGFITQKMAAKYGIPYLFLNPEYLGQVNFFSYFILGVSLGGLIIAFNISSYIMNSFRFPFLATLSNPFPKYIFNNFLVTGIFLMVFSVKVFLFQTEEQFESSLNAFLDVLAIWTGVIFFIMLSISYFFRTNKDLFRLFNVHTADAEPGPVKSISKVRMQKNMKWKALNESDRDWKVETYFSGKFRMRIARGYAHYDKEKLLSVFRQNHTNAAVFELFVVLSILLFGIFREIPAFAIPAGASVLLIFTMYVMLTSAMYNWLRGWSSTVFFVLILGLNLMFSLEPFYVTNAAYGLNYNVSRPTYSLSEIQKLSSDSVQMKKDMASTIEMLEKWRKKNSYNTLKRRQQPRLVLLNASGGGARSALWSFYALQHADSLLQGELLNHTVLISGASGGMVGLSYLRELYLRKRLNKLRSYYRQSFVRDIGQDLLNPIVFSMTVNDLFLRTQKVKVGELSYTKDRGSAFESRLNQITRNYLNKKISDYAPYEKEAQIPMMIFSPVSINDGRRIYISAQPVSYLTYCRSGYESFERIPESVEFSRFFKNQGADNLLFTSAIRMSATFPVIMPVVSLPSEPEMHVVDAGGKDNLGMETSLKFLHTFRDWIQKNTSGVVIIQIRDRHKIVHETLDGGNHTLFEALGAPIQSLYNNLFSVQDYAQDQLLEYARSWYPGKLEVVSLQLLNQKPDKISLSWHLTEKEKKRVCSSIELPENKAAIDRIRELLE